MVIDMARAGVDHGCMFSEGASLYQASWRDSREQDLTFSSVLQIWVPIRTNVTRTDYPQMRLDIPANLADAWRAAADTYLTSLRVANQEWDHATRRRTPLFRTRRTFLAKAKRDAAVTEAEDVYGPIRTAATEALEEAYAPQRARQQAITRVETMPGWSFTRRGKTARIHARRHGKTLDELLTAISKERR
jgi:hypothetical protein